MAGLGDDARVVAAAGQHEGHFGVAQVVQLVDRAPWRDVVALGPDHEDRQAQIGQRDGAAVHPVAAGGQRIVQVERGQVLVVHARRHAGGVRVPGHQVVGLLAFAHQVLAHAPGPDQVARVQELERTRHLFAAEVALPQRDVVQEADLAFIDEQAQLTGFRKVGLRGQQGERLQRRQSGVAHHAASPGLGQRRSRDGQQGATQAITHGMHRMGFVLQVADRLQRVQHAELEVVVHREVVVGCIRIAPGQHVHRMALLHEVAHHRILRREIEDVELHDPRRDDEDRLRMHGGRLRVVADQFHQPVPVHHLAGRDRDVAPHLEAFLLREILSRRHSAGVGHPVAITLDEVCTVGFGHVLQHHRIRGQPVRRCHHAQPLPREKPGQIGMVRRHARNLRCLAPERLGVAEAGAQLTERPSAPGLVAEPGVVVDRGLLGVLDRSKAQRVACQLGGERCQFHLATGRNAQVPGPVGHGQGHGDRRE